jgi:hypothetical protein
MNTRPVILLTAILLLTTSRIAVGQSSLTVSNGSEGPLTITTAVAGSAPMSVVGSATTYHVIHPVGSGGLARITMRLDTAMPAGTTLFVTLAAPPGATSLGQIALTTVDQDVVIDVPEGTDTAGLTITYRFAATAAAGVVPSQSRTVTLDVQ